MRNSRIYCAQNLGDSQQFKLDAGPSQHIARALRMRPGDALTLFDGRGGEYAATITELNKKTVTVTTNGFTNQDSESPLAVHLGIGISRGDRMDWVVQKATELGVQAISPLLTERTEVKLKSERALKKLQHWRQIAITACEQCGRNRIPQIHPLQELPGWLNNTSAQRKLVLHHRALGSQSDSATPTSLALLVGPEGGLSEIEIGAAEVAGFQSLRLGPRVLRTETAPLAALAIVQARWGDMAAAD